MKKGISIIILLIQGKALFAQNEIGPEGHKLLWALLLVVLIAGAFLFFLKPAKKNQKKINRSLFKSYKLSISLEKDRLYYPDNLSLIVKNSGNADIDLDQPLLEFDNFWMKRKFKIKGMGSHSFYPLYLEKGKTHTLQIDLTRFYQHDKSLKKFPKAKIILSDVKGKKMGSKSIFMRKTLFRF